MSLPFVDRHPTITEFERFRLLFSTYQDGSGQQALKDGRTLPGWRDFERSVALAFDGLAQENKFIFDVLLPYKKEASTLIGISCKMRRTLNDTKRTGRATLELSNSSGKFWERLGQIGINQLNYRSKSQEVAQVLLAQEHEWHEQVGLSRGGNVDIDRSFYLALSWNLQGEYQLFQFALNLPDVTTLNWDFPSVTSKTGEKTGRRLRGQDAQGTLFEWYGESGGQLKYYPLVDAALWKSDIFRLEALTNDWQDKHGILAKARDYFPKQWRNVE